MKIVKSLGTSVRSYMNPSAHSVPSVVVTSGGLKKLKFELPGVPPSWNKLIHLHWSKYQAIKQEWEWLVKIAAPRGMIRQPLGTASISVTCYVSHPARRDSDNIFIKPILDQLVKLNLIRADDASVVESVKIRVRPAGGSAERTLVELLGR